jgi:hypothetical protein
MRRTAAFDERSGKAAVIDTSEVSDKAECRRAVASWRGGGSGRCEFRECRKERQYHEEWTITKLCGWPEHVRCMPRS